MSATEATSPDTKKQKMTVEISPDSEWPEAWYIAEKAASQKEEDRCDPNEPVSVDAMKALGILYWKMDADKYEYPLKAVPWDPKDAQDPKLKSLRDDRGYSYADIISIHPDHLPGFEDKVKSFFEEHIHDAGK